MSSVAASGPIGTAPSRALGRWLPPVLSMLLIVLLFEMLARSGLLPASAFPPMTETLGELVSQLQTGGFWRSVGFTTLGWAIGLGIAVAVAVPLGIVVGSTPILYRASRGVIEFLRPIPSVSLIPLAILIYGTGMESKVFLVFFAALWPLLMQTLYGVQDVDPVAYDTARSFGFPRRQCLLKITLPSAVPYIATGLRLASTVALILAVTAELVIGAPGIGRDINLAQSAGAASEMYALIIVTGLMGWGLNALFGVVERRVLHWHQSQRSRRDAR